MHIIKRYTLKNKSTGEDVVLELDTEANVSIVTSKGVETRLSSNKDVRDAEMDLFTSDCELIKTQYLLRESL
jgi:hypothetical protein